MLYKWKEVLFMNNKGQSLVTFVLILPIIVLFLLFFIGSAMSYMEKAQLEGIIYDTINVVVEQDIRDENKIEEVIHENDSSIILEISIVNDEIKITGSKSTGIMKNNSQLKVRYCANYQSKKIKKEC